MGNVMTSGSPASLIIFLLTIGVSLYVMYGNRALYDKMILHPYTLVHDRKWFTIITSGFIHADLWHLGFNMISFYFFAFRLEALIGTENFLIIYFSSMVLADIPTVIKHKDNVNYRSLGASGAVAAIIFSSILFAPTATFNVYFIPMPAIVYAVLFLVYGWYMGKKGMDYINHSAHNWGALSGIILTIILIPESLNYFIHQLF